MATIGRPDESAARREHILEAAARCIVANGLRGASLEAIAREAGTTRGNVRYFLGNREQLLDALLQRINSRDHQTHTELARIEPAERRREALLDYLFGDGFASQEADTQVLLHFYLAARSDASIRSALTAGYSGILATIDEALRESPAHADSASVLLALALGRAILIELDLPEQVSGAMEQHARSLVSGGTPPA